MGVVGRAAVLGVLIGALAGFDGAAAADKAPPTVQQNLDLQTVGAARISPDGRRVVYEQSRTNWDANAFETDLWIADAAGGERQLLTVAVKSSTDAAWSPDGRWIAFLSDRPGVLPKSPANVKQLYVMPASGGEAQQVTRFEKGATAFEWAPDSRRLAALAEGPPAQPMKDRAETFGDYRIVRGDYAMAHLWLLELPQADTSGRRPAQAEPKALTSGDRFSVSDLAWSPDGTKIAFSAQRDPDLVSGGTSKIYTVAVADQAVTPLVEGAGPNAHPRWSPDGRQIAFETAAGEQYFFYANQKIGVVSASGGTVRVANPAFDEDAVLLDWGPDGIYFGAREKTEIGPFRLDPTTGVARRIALPGLPMAQRVSFTPDHRKIAFAGAAPNRYAEVYVADLAGDRPPVRITRAGDQLDGFAVARREAVRWTSADGTPIEGVLERPANFDPKKKYPLLVVIHGGPTGIDTPTVTPNRNYPVERFVARGALVLRPNYRGSAGYGGKFRALNVRNLGVGDYADVISGVDSLIAKGFVDRDRVAAMGWSQGGYISAFITTSSDRFKAVSVGAGISDWMTYYANTDITPFTAQYLKANPWTDPAIYRKTSPISYVAKAKTPTLIQHGSNDRRVPIANAYELRQALEDHNVPVKMVVYEGFGHGINKPRQQRAVLEENEAWFGHYIFGDPLAAGLTPDARPEAKPGTTKAD